MAIYSRMHNGKKQWQYRTYYKAIDGSRKQKNSKWFDTKKTRKCKKENKKIVICIPVIKFNNVFVI
jgi:hypothetical protein